MPIRRLMLLMIVAAAVLAACAGAPAAPTALPAPAAQVTAPTDAPLAQDNLAYAEALRLAAEAGSLAQNKGDANLIGLLTIRSLMLHYTPDADALLSSLTTRGVPPLVFTGHADQGPTCPAP